MDAGDVLGTVEAAERGLEIDGLNEELWRVALEAEGAAGLRGAVDNRLSEAPGRSRSTIGIGASERNAVATI
jgi:hypothetical protein